MTPAKTMHSLRVNFANQSILFSPCPPCGRMKSVEVLPVWLRLAPLRWVGVVVNRSLCRDPVGIKAFSLLEPESALFGWLVWLRSVRGGGLGAVGEGRDGTVGGLLRKLIHSILWSFWDLFLLGSSGQWPPLFISHSRVLGPVYKPNRPRCMILARLALLSLE